MGFAMALSEACQNIVEHAGTGGWVAVHAYNFRRRLGRRVVVIAVSDAGIGFRRSLEATQAKRFGDRWGDGAALEAALIQGVSRFRDPGRGPGTRRASSATSPRWQGKISHPQRHRAARHRAGLGRRRAADRTPVLFPGRPGADHHPRPGRRTDDDRRRSGSARMLRETVTTPYSDLVTRPTGVAVRDRIEAGARRAPSGGTALLDFSDVGLLDFSCADEVVAKLLLDTTGTDAIVVLRGLREDHTKRSSTCSTHHALAVVVQDSPDGRSPSAGPGRPPTSSDVFERLHAHGAARRRDAGRQRLGWDASARAGRARRAGSGSGWSAPDGLTFAPLPHRMNTPLGLSTIADPRRARTAAPTGRPVGPPADAEQHLHQPGRLRRGGALHPLRQQPEPGRRWRRKYALLEGRRGGDVPVERHGARPRWRTSRCSARATTCVSSEWIYGGTKRLFDEEFGRFGIEVTYVTPTSRGSGGSRCARPPGRSSSRRRPTR